ncbi:hypothetical protein LINPERPRIM_LOCUS33661 [Linum perenne]
MMMNKQQHMLMTWLLSSIGVLKPSSTFRWLHMRRSLQIWRDSPEKSISDRSGGKVVGSLVEFPSIEELPGTQMDIHHHYHVNYSNLMKRNTKSQILYDFNFISF